jgi:hypothetical protein
MMMGLSAGRGCPIWGPKLVGAFVVPPRRGWSLHEEEPYAIIFRRTVVRQVKPLIRDLFPDQHSTLRPAIFRKRHTTSSKLASVTLVNPSTTSVLRSNSSFAWTRSYSPVTLSPVAVVRLSESERMKPGRPGRIRSPARKRTG